MSLDEARKYLGFKTMTSLYRYIDEGLPVIIVGKSKRISRSMIDKFMVEHQVIQVKEDKE